MTRTPIYNKHGKRIGYIERCKHGSRFIQSKRVGKGHCVNYGIYHNC